MNSAFNSSSTISSSSSSPFCDTFCDIFAPIDKITIISDTLKNLNLADLQNCVSKIIALKIGTHEELKHFVDVIVKDVRAAKDSGQKYAKLAFVFGDLQAATVNGTINLKTQMTESCQISLMNSLKPQFDEHREREIYLLIEFIAELYNLNVVDQAFIKICMDELLERETSCFFCLHCIYILMRIVGSKNDIRDHEMIERYFWFFEHAVEVNAIPYRTKVYKALVALKKTGWMRNQLLFDVKMKSAPPIANSVTIPAKPFPIVTSNNNAVPTRVPITVPAKSQPMEVKIFPILEKSLKTSTFSNPEKLLKTVEIQEIQETQKHCKYSIENTESSEAEKPGKIQEICQSSTEVDENLLPEPKKPQQSSIDTTTPTPEPKISLTITLDDLNSAAETLKQKLTTSVAMKTFVTTVLKQVTTDHSKTSLYAKLCKKLTDFPDEFGMNFKEILNENVFKKFATFVSKQNLDEIAMVSFGNLLLMVAELYNQDIFSDEDLCIWLNTKHAKKISLEYLTKISSIISMKILVNGENNMMTVLKNLEITIYDETMKGFLFIRSDIDELKNLMNGQN